MYAVWNKNVHKRQLTCIDGERFVDSIVSSSNDSPGNDVRRNWPNQSKVLKTDLVI